MLNRLNGVDEILNGKFWAFAERLAFDGVGHGLLGEKLFDSKVGVGVGVMTVGLFDVWETVMECAVVVRMGILKAEFSINKVNEVLT